MTTSLRSQCLLVDDDYLAQARADISHRNACLPNSAPSPLLWSQFRALESQALTAQQVFHKDSTVDAKSVGNRGAAGRRSRICCRAGVTSSRRS
jgi:hypothetical protein